MKLFLSFISILFMSLIPINVIEEINDFKDTCNNGYNTYYYLEETSIASYDLIIAVGEYNNQIGYSIFFRPTDPNTYYLQLTIDGQEILKTKKDYEVLNLYNLILPKEATISVIYQNVVTYTITILPLTYDEYISNNTINIIQGNNQGLEPIEIKPYKVPSSTIIFSIIFIILIILSIIIILVCYILKKGLFNQKNYEKEFAKEHEIRSIIQEENETVEVIEEKTIEVYKKNIDEEIEVRDISLILKERGFNIDYASLSNEQKNLIMLELMKMRDFKEITQEEYRAEVIKLWM